MNKFVKGTIILSNRCNLNCTYCYVKTKSSVLSLSVRTIRTFIKWFIEQPVDEDYKKLNLFGGEPFLEFNLLKEAIIFFKKHNRAKKSIIDTIPTNGTILTQEILNFVKKEKLRVSFSLDGTKMNNFARKFQSGENCFDLVMQNLRRFTDFIGTPPLIKMTMLPANVANLYSNVEFLIENGFYNLWPNPGVFDVKWKEKDVDIFTDQYEKVLKLYLKKRLLQEPFNLTPVDDVLMFCRKGVLREHDCFCGLGEEPILSFDGNIYACDSVLLGIDELVNKFKVGEVVRNKVNIDLNKMRFFQEYNFLEEHKLRNKNHPLAYLFRRRPCFALDENGKTLKKENIESILAIHLKIHALTLKLFNKYASVLK